MLHKVLFDRSGNIPERTILTGYIVPWVNPYLWELDLTAPANIELARKLTRQLESLDVATAPFELTEAEITAALEANNYSSKKGTYTKPETELERLSARADFLKEQLADLFEFTTLYNLAGQIEATKANSEATSPSQVIENSIQTTIELLSIIMGK